MPAGLRPACPDDLAGIVVLLRDCDLRELGRPDTSERDVRESWLTPGMDVTTDTWVAVDDRRPRPAAGTRAPAGRRSIVGYAEITRRPAAERLLELDGDFWVAPGQPTDDLAAVLLDALLRRAAAMAGPRDARLAVFCARANAGKRATLLRRGFVACRSYLRMGIDLREEYACDPPPPGIRLSSFDPDADVAAVRRLVTAAFSADVRPRHEPLAEWRARLIDRPGFDRSLWVLARERGHIVGVALACDFGDIGWVQGLAVRADRRGCGIGLALLRETFGRFATRGRLAVHLGVDVEDTSGARRLYERAGMYEEQRADLFTRATGCHRSAAEPGTGART